MNSQSDILLVSPYHGGSHQAWAEGYQTFSQQAVSLLTLPARFWKWRMHGGAVTLARRFLGNAAQPGVIVATDMLDMTTFLALTRQRTYQIPVYLYMHENQLTYPLPADGRTGPMRRQKGERDLHYAFINVASMLAVDLVLFNSHFHRDSFFAALPRFLQHYPEYNELNAIEQLQQKSHVLPIGVDLGRLALPAQTGAATAAHLKFSDPTHSLPPLILWNQRWEYDKNPTTFFEALDHLAETGVPFRVALCGEQFGKRPSVFDEAIARLGKRVVHAGFAPTDTYRRLLWEAAVTISTAHHEFFGISIVEAIFCHTFPILPARLSYPEIIPAAFHQSCLYEDEEQLITKLRWALAEQTAARQIAAALAQAMTVYDWPQMASRYDEVFQEQRTSF